MAKKPFMLSTGWNPWLQNHSCHPRVKTHGYKIGRAAGTKLLHQSMVILLIINY